MNNLIIDAGNYSNIGGKSYSVDELACNYPISQTFNDRVDVTNNSTLITTTGDFTLLLGCDLQNSNVPLVKWLVTSGDGGVVLEISHLINATTAVLKYPCVATTGNYTFQSVDFYGQPAVGQTFGLDATSGFAFPVVYFTKYGPCSAVFGGTVQPIGAEPILLNLTEYPTAGLNIQYV